MEEYHKVLKKQTDALSSSLDVTSEFPDIKGASVEFL
jgi:hypothetical protein